MTLSQFIRQHLTLFEAPASDIEAAAKSVEATFKRHEKHFDSFIPADYRVEETNTGWMVDIRHWGNWESEPGTDDEDDDWEIPTEKTGQMASEVVEAFRRDFPQFKFYLSFGEKNWLTVEIEEK